MGCCFAASCSRGTFWKHSTAREFPFVFPWQSLLWHALLFMHSVSILKFLQASLQMKHCITEEVKPLKVSAFAKHLEQIQSALIYQKWTRKLTLQNLWRTIVLSWAVWCSFLKSWAVLLFFLPHHEWRFYICIEPNKVVRAELHTSKSFWKEKKFEVLCWNLLRSLTFSVFHFHAEIILPFWRAVGCTNYCLHTIVMVWSAVWVWRMIISFPC